MKNPANRYFLALIPPEPLFGIISKLKESIASEYETKAALKSPPHITLHMPFVLPDKKVDVLCHALEVLSDKQSSFLVEFNNFNHYGERVLFIDIKKTDPLISLQANLQKVMRTQVNIFNANRKDGAFNPHLTIAFRDLKKEHFKKAWEDLQTRKFKDTFTANRITLLRHNGLAWEIFKHFTLTL